MPLRRRDFLRQLSWLSLAFFLACAKKKSSIPKKRTSEDTTAHIFRAVNGSPEENMDKVLSMMGGIETLVGAEDIVMIKPNLQWFNQGAPNIAAIATLITMIMDRKGGFKGEVVIAENIHRGATPRQTSGWNTPFERNSEMAGITNYNGLVDHLKMKFGDRFSACPIIDIESGGQRVYSPADGPGYVLCDGSGGVPLLSLDNGSTGAKRREVIMSYPIIKTDRGTLVDYRWGVWEKGTYTSQPVKFINCAALNHHSAACGMTSAMKNYLGISDLSGGSDPVRRGKLIGNYQNFHSFAFNKSDKGPVPGMLGAEIGYFLKTVRRPSLNITTAHYCGIIDRTRPPVALTKLIAASTDPVALDFHMAKYVLYPNSRISVHNPEASKSPTSQTLAKCAIYGDYCFDEGLVDIRSYDFLKGAFQTDEELTVRSETLWGGNLRSLLKYLLFRMKLAG